MTASSARSSTHCSNDPVVSIPVTGGPESEILRFREPLQTDRLFDVLLGSGTERVSYPQVNPGEFRFGRFINQ